MTNSSDVEATGKMISHADGLGVASPEQVEKRARELALIDGRAENEFSERDLDTARSELLGISTPPDDVDLRVESMVEWDTPPSAAGGLIQEFETPDEQTVAQRLVEEGVDEALHDQMVESRHMENEEDQEEQ